MQASARLSALSRVTTFECLHSLLEMPRVLLTASQAGVRPAWVCLCIGPIPS